MDGLINTLAVSGELVGRSRLKGWRLDGQVGSLCASLTSCSSDFLVKNDDGFGSGTISPGKGERRSKVNWHGVCTGTPALPGTPRGGDPWSPISFLEEGMCWP